MSRLEDALFIAERFGPVLPLCWPVFDELGRPHCGCGQGHQDRDIGKAPIGRLVPHGFHDASRDPEVIRRWWTEYPEANVGLALEPAGLVFIGPDCQEAFDDFVSRGLPATVIRISKNPGFLYTRPEGCPATRRARSGWADILSTGYVVAAGVHASGAPIYLENLALTPPPAPEWAVRLLSESAAAARTLAGGTVPEPVEPPVPLRGDALRLWYGELAVLRNDPQGFLRPPTDGEVDRSRTLFQVALALARAGLQQEGLLALAVEQYDRRMGFDKYTHRRDAPVRYEEIARQAVGIAKLDLKGLQPAECGTAEGGELPPFTDKANAELAARLLEGQIAWTSSWGWLVWNGWKWERDPDGVLVRRRLMDAMTAYWGRLVGELEDVKARKEVAERIIKIQAVARTNAAMEVLPAYVLRKPAEFDRDPYLLNTPGGVVDLRTGRVTPSRPDLLLSRSTAVAPDFEARCPRWESFLREIFDGDEKLITYIRRLLGYGLLGGNPERLFVVFWGRGANGKSVLVETFLSIIGDYGAVTGVDSFEARKAGDPRNDLARLVGVRVVAASETEEKRRLDAAVVKLLTGDDVILARFLHREFFEFRPEFLPIIRTNHMPNLPGDDQAIWDRVRLVPFRVSIPPERREKNLRQRLVAEEGPAILAWAIRGCVEYLEKGLPDLPAVSEATRQWRARMLPVVGWIQERCIEDPTAKTPIADLYADYERWCQEEDVQPIDKRGFGKVLEQLGYELVRSLHGGIRCRRGLRLR